MYTWGCAPHWSTLYICVRMCTLHLCAYVSIHFFYSFLLYEGCCACVCVWASRCAEYTN